MLRVTLAVVGASFLLGVCPLYAAGMDDAVALFESEQYEAARDAFKKLAKNDENNPDILFNLGRCALKLEDHDKAIELIEKALEIDDSKGTYYDWLGKAYVEKIDHSSFIKKKSIAGDIKRCFLAAVERDPENIEYRESLANFYFQAPGMVGGSDEKALEHINEIIKRDRREGLRVKTDFYSRKERWDEAIATYEEIASLDPADTEPIMSIGFVCQNAERYDDAFAAFERCLKIDADDTRALYQVGRTSVMSASRLERGEAAFREFLAMDESEDAPSHANAHWRLGMLYELQGRDDEAVAEYEVAIEKDNENENAKRSLKQIKKKNGKLRRNR